MTKGTSLCRQKSPNCNIFYFLFNKTTQDINTSSISRINLMNQHIFLPIIVLIVWTFFQCCFFSFVVVGRKPIFFFLYLRHADDIVSCKYEKAEICIRIFYYFSLPTERHHKLIRGIVFLCVITLMCCSCCFGQFIDNLIRNTQWMRKNPHIHDYSENLTQRRVRTVKRLMVFK